jgi:hypothetical protein
VTEGHNDYGTGFGSYCLANNYNGPSYACAPQDGTGYEGLSFWARDPALPLDSVPGVVLTNFVGGRPPADAGPIRIVDSGYYDATVYTTGTTQAPFIPKTTTKGVTIFFDDQHSTTLAVPYGPTGNLKPTDPQYLPNACDPPMMMGTCYVSTMDPTGASSTSGSGCVPLPNWCGNSFTRTLTLTDQWQLYLLPFTSFKQEALPNRSSEGPDPARIFTFGMRFPKEAVAEVWLSNLAFYRKKQ